MRQKSKLKSKFIIGTMLHMHGRFPEINA